MAEDRKATILVVEDDPGVACFQQLRLQRQGYAVAVAATAAAALDVLRARRVDLLLLDQNLRDGVSGLDLYRQIKDAGWDVPAILVTGFTGENVVLQAFRAGVHDFVPKTADYIDYLLPTIERVLLKRQTERQLIESEARLAGIVRSARDAILAVDEDRRVATFNPAAEQMFVVPAAEAIGLPIDRLIPAWPDKALESAPGVDEQPAAWETEGARASGTRFPVEVAISRVEANGRTFWTCVVRDVADRKKAQQERERLIREQAARQHAETAREQMAVVARENVRLYQELQQADRRKDEFLAMLAHELRNPLAPIRNALHTLRLTGDTQHPETLETWFVIERQVEHLVRLIDDLLDVSRISEGKIRLQKERVELAAVVQRAVEAGRPLVQSRGHALTVQLPDESLVVHGDPVRLVQVLANLLNNAAKYTPEGGQVSLTLERRGNRGALRVRDTGMGLAPEVLPTLFDLFSQSERTLDRSEGGLGIGLTLVRRLAEMHGGRVQAFSDGPGKGSEFVVELPLADPAPLTIPVTEEPEAPGRTISRRILVVDDSKDSARTLCRLLRTLGHRASAAHSGPEGLALAEEAAPEVVLLDIGLPGMDGYEVARRLRATPKFNRTLLVALTGYGSPRDRELSYEAGFNVHLVKPVDLDALTKLLQDPEALFRQPATSNV